MGLLLGGSTKGLTPTSSKRAYATHCDRVLLDHSHTQTLKGRFCSVSVGSLAPDFRKILFEPSEHLLRVCSLILNVILPLLPFYLGFSFPLEHGVYFFGEVQHSPVDGYSTPSCNFGVLIEEDECKSFYSTILEGHLFLILYLIISLKFYCFSEFKICLKNYWFSQNG